MSRYSTFVVLVLLGNIGLQAQTLTPPLLPGEIPSPIVRTEANAQNVFLMGWRVANEFDDNALNHDSNKQANVLTVVEPRVGWSLSTPRSRWTLSYRPGFAVGHPLSIYDSRSQMLDTELQVTLAKHLQLRLREALLQSKDVFDQLQQSEPTTGSSVLDRPNSSILPSVRKSSEQAGADISYAWSPRTVVGASAAFYRVNYTSALDAQALGRAKSGDMQVFSSYHLSRHHWVGVDYSLRDLISQQPQSRSLVQSVLYTDTLLLRPSMSISFFAGPQHSLTRGEAGLHFVWDRPHSAQANWSWAGAVNYVWSGERASLTVGLSHRISDGAGLQGIVQLTSATAEVRRQLTKRLSGQVLVSDNRNRALLSGLTPLSYISFASGMSRALSQRLSLECQYWHLHETSTGAQAGNYLANHNRISMSLTYDFKVPLQR
jgi:hypothetical protein